MRKKIGEVLIDAGLITSKQLENAVLLQRGKNKRIGKVLLELGYVSEQQVAETLAKQFSIPFIDCNSYPVSKETISLIPKEMAESKLIFPLKTSEKNLLLAMADPLDMETVDKVSFKTGMKVSPAVSSESSILTAIERNYGIGDRTGELLKEISPIEGVELVRGSIDEEAEKKDVDIKSLYKLSEAPPVIKLVTMMILDSVRLRASDIHIEPQEKDVAVRYRIDGNLKNIFKIPKHVQDPVILRLKIISNLDLMNRKLPQEGRCTLKYEGKYIDLRVSTVPSVYGENVAIKIIDRSTRFINFGKLGLSDYVEKPLIKLCNQSNGLILVAGPAGSGKTTTIYAILHQLKTEIKKVMSIEDPVEYRLEGVTQTAVNESIGRTFPNIFRAILKQDPDIIMLSEIRNKETADMAARTALTDHLVLSSVSASDSISAITTLLDLGIEPFLLSSSITGILAQRLIRKICPSCRTQTNLPKEFARDYFPDLKQCFKGSGCNECLFTGYRGLVGIYEFLPMTSKLKKAIVNNASEEELWEIARREGMVTLFENAWARIKDGVTTPDEVVSKVPFGRMKEKETAEEKEKTKVLLFNINDDDADVIRKALTTQDYEVVNVSGEDILEAAAKENPDCLFIDASKKTAELLRNLRKEIRYTYLSIFAVAKSIETEIEKEMMKLGIRGFLYSPMEPETVLNVFGFSSDTVQTRI